MSNVDIGRYSKRVLQYFWDPPPRNDDPSEAPIWVLGRQYEAIDPIDRSSIAREEAETRRQQEDGQRQQQNEQQNEPQDEPQTQKNQQRIQINTGPQSPSPSASSNPSPIDLFTSHHSKPPSMAASSTSMLEHPSATSSLEDLGRSHASSTDPPPSASNGNGPGSTNEDADADGGWPAAFLDDFESRVWMTYRSGFPCIERTAGAGAGAGLSLGVRLRQLGGQGGFTSDSGWGCMIRSGQSLFANALVMLRFGRDWRRGEREAEEKELLALFADDPNAPFSIHRFVDHGASACGKHPGEWFGPSATARCIQALANQHESLGLKVYITGDGPEVYEDDFMKIARTADGGFAPTLILICTRLGIDRVTPVYWEALKSALQMRQSIGIAGGRPSSSHYFLGLQSTSLFYLDPHTTRPFLPLPTPPTAYTPAEVSSCHTRRLRRIQIAEMDPSMLIGFLIRDEEDWRAWKESVGEEPGRRVMRVERGVGEREGAMGEVEVLSDEEGEEEGVVV
ncbi:hypothetical protein P152DRAFT_475431 [Eremomyces bilateralis CBS 781.70]|uniref:Cysteine protease n=1 Tax=Eremomyces bilateralis CBS 781.70 TaxID=1392243 RepID=A0A6G1FYF2_9PEZI|nr:uncharacterized protein P152DRAFT_475431 [Eremomyces bilateralis CBS 781.70]KAF1810599.1 hypothetical protein P152DRAFT_475431 [Eremomyces bilateralis CBS 781.70]